MKNLIKKIIVVVLTAQNVAAEKIRNPFEPVTQKREAIEIPSLLAITELDNQPAAIMRVKDDTSIVFVNDQIGKFTITEISETNIKLKKDNQYYNLEL